MIRLGYRLGTCHNESELEVANMQNVDIRVEWAFDIRVELEVFKFDIECYARYRRSDTRYRGGKDPS
jgi:hypothetical protein